MKYLLSVLVVLLVQNHSFGHDHNLATFTIYKNRGAWLLKIDFTTSTMLESIDKKYKSSKISDLEVKEAIIRYFKNKISFKINDSIPVLLDQGGIKYGSHSSEVLFILKGFKEDWDTLFCDIQAFKENENQSNIVRVHVSADRYKAFLTFENQFNTTFERIRLEAE